MKYYVAKYTDLDGVEHSLPTQTQAQLNVAFEHIANSGEYVKGSWVETFVYED